MAFGFYRLRIFLSYPHEEVERATALKEALVGLGASVFFDRDPAFVPPGDSYRRRIRDEVFACHIFVFLVSPHSIAAGRFTLTELGYAQERWPNPAGRVLPVAVPATAAAPDRLAGAPDRLAGVPPYLTANVTVLFPVGDFATETADRVLALHRSLRRAYARKVLSVAGAAVLACAVVGAGYEMRSCGERDSRPDAGADAETRDVALADVAPVRPRRIVAEVLAKTDLVVDDDPAVPCDKRCSWVVDGGPHVLHAVSARVCFAGCDDAGSASADGGGCDLAAGTIDRRVAVTPEPTAETRAACTYAVSPGEAKDHEHCVCRCGTTIKDDQYALEGAPTCDTMKRRCCGEDGSRCLPHFSPLPCPAASP